MDSEIKLIVGLGNPGQKYDWTRHNIGFLALDEMVRRDGAKFANHLKWRAHVAKMSGISALLMKPQTFMNESGRAVAAAMKFYKWKPEQVLVLFDDISLPLGTLRFRMKGSAGGHNGIKSLIAHLGTNEFPRLKMGIGGPEGALVGHVLGKFSPDERNEVQNTLASSADAVQLALSQGLGAAANSYNSRK
ncbi:aminoacyl-tRNA hydrolase [Persicirhabdus sediminis]|uniref:Peptidyl-tRNA hydrolase n=1 Tax=Persicirhabdus sediminis TaxID=454144 RepID=A0A8J7SQ42_9BACT|nr:aminoacyl-tRNA hydrolase [Persicirhabdus sediminis]MBK1792753.1 aminoacyl-tRNA hydrolase [Persicirhabdus sediminis]